MQILPADWQQICQLVEDVWEWLYAQIGKHHSRPRLPDLKMTRDQSFRIAGFDWEMNNLRTLSASLESRLFLESGYLLSGLKIPGGGDSSSIDTLREKLAGYTTHHEDNSTEPLPLQAQESFFYYAEVTSDLPLPLVCRRIFETVPVNEEDRIAVCEFSWGCVGIPRDKKDQVLILRPAAGEPVEVEDASHFVNTILPRLILYYRKSVLRYREYEDEYEKVKQIAQRLARMLAGREHSGNLLQLEERIKDISALTDELVEGMGHLKKRLIAMDNDLRQIRSVLQDPVLFGRNQDLSQIYGESCAMMLEHVRTDFRYLQAHNDEAQISLQTLQAFVSVEQAKLQREGNRAEQRFVLMLGVVGLVLAVVDGFADVVWWPYRTALVFLGVIAAYLVWKNM